MADHVADLRSVTRSATLNAAISATAIIADIAEGLVRMALADHPGEQTISLLAISVSNLGVDSGLQMELSLGLEMKSSALARKQAWRVGQPIALSTRFEIVLDGTP